MDHMRTSRPIDCANSSMPAKGWSETGAFTLDTYERVAIGLYRLLWT